MWSWAKSLSALLDVLEALSGYGNWVLLSKVWLQRLPYRVTEAGQSGGGQEMKEALLLESDEPVLAEGSVCHTDGAKAYRQPVSALPAGALMDGSLTKFGLKLAHSPVKHKPPTPVRQAA